MDNVVTIIADFSDSYSLDTSIVLIKNSGNVTSTVSLFSIPTDNDKKYNVLLLLKIEKNAIIINRNETGSVRQISSILNITPVDKRKSRTPIALIL
jgi:hypothetical protein